MIEKKEISAIVIAVLILSFAIIIWNFNLILPIMLSVSVVILTNIIAKEISARYFEAKIEHKIWELQRYGWIGVFSGSIFHPSKKFKNPVLVGAFLPIITSVLSFGYFIWTAILVFDAKPSVSRAAKRHGNILIRKCRKSIWDTSQRREFSQICSSRFWGISSDSRNLQN